MNTKEYKHFYRIKCASVQTHLTPLAISCIAETRNETETQIFIHELNQFGLTSGKYARKCPCVEQISYFHHLRVAKRCVEKNLAKFVPRRKYNNHLQFIKITTMNEKIGTDLCCHDALSLMDEFTLGATAIPIRTDFLMSPQSRYDSMISASSTFWDASEHWTRTFIHWSRMLNTFIRNTHWCRQHFSGTRYKSTGGWNIQTCLNRRWILTVKWTKPGKNESNWMHCSDMVWRRKIVRTLRGRAQAIYCGQPKLIINWLMARANMHC